MNLPTDIAKAIEDMSAYHLAEAIGRATPDSSTSAGATFLASVRDSFLESLANVDVDDMSSLGDATDRAVAEISDAAPDVDTYTRWTVYTDLCAWEIDLSDVGIESVRVDDLTRDLAGPTLAFIARDLLAWLIDYTATEYETLIDAATDAAESLGRAHGRNAAEWWAQENFGGRAPSDVAPLAARVIAGIDDGDPEVMDTLPRADLSGEWADGLDTRGLLDSVGMSGADDAGEVATSLADAYETAFSDAAQDYVTTVARSVVAATDLTPDTMTRDQLLAYVAEHGIKTSEGRIRVDPELLDTHLLRAAVAAHTAA